MGTHLVTFPPERVMQFSLISLPIRAFVNASLLFEYCPDIRDESTIIAISKESKPPQNPECHQNRRETLILLTVLLFGDNMSYIFKVDSD